MWRPLALAIASFVAVRLKRLRNVASWITFASWWAVSSSVRSTSMRAIVVTGMPLVDRDVARQQGRRPVDPRRGLHAAPLRDNDINEGGAEARHLPELPAGQMAQCRSLTCLEHRAHEHVDLARERDVPDGVHAARDAVQPAGRDPARDGATIEPRREELRERHEPVLARGQRRDLRVRRGGWGTKPAVSERFVPHPPNLVQGA